LDFGFPLYFLACCAVCVVVFGRFCHFWSFIIFKVFRLFRLILLRFPSFALLSVFLTLALFLWSRMLGLSDTSFVSFLFSFLFAFVVVLVHLIPSLQSFCFSVRLPGLFILSAKKIIFHCFALLQHSTIRTDWPHKIRN
jgi:hypothetical protein